MDVHAQTGNIRTLERIVALLAALAGLAETASTRSLPVRWLVLAILRRAEQVARDFVAGETGLLPPAAEEFAAGRNGPADALPLAAQFRVLAAALDAFLRLASLFGGRNARAYCIFCLIVARSDPLHLTLGGTEAKTNDTS